MMASQSQGIQQLLQAEKRAKDKLDEAKKRKGKRLKQAKEEAMAEIDQYRMQKEKEFQEKQSLARLIMINLSLGSSRKTYLESEEESLWDDHIEFHVMLPKYIQRHL
ncbi:V-type proton ATPase subunit G 3 isoform X2 [Petaurus breviceps papuanus]|uniref:V-type proton ATPase subunit G 3 isoform X2 n=1 Tax=Petaurus breviceps papuanus TaxID=3040969 RepID=UPI0036DF434B